MVLKYALGILRYAGWAQAAEGERVTFFLKKSFLLWGSVLQRLRNAEFWQMIENETKWAAVTIVTEDRPATPAGELIRRCRCSKTLVWGNLLFRQSSSKNSISLIHKKNELSGHNSHWEPRPGSLWVLSLDWLLDTDETLELRTNPREARRAAGRAEKPGGRRPDWPDLSRRLFGMVSGPALLGSPKGRKTSKKTRKKTLKTWFSLYWNKMNK